MTTSGKGIDSLSIHLKISEMTEAHSPMFIDNKIIFSYSNNKRYIQRVAIAFESDNYRKVYSFMKNEYDVFFFIKGIPEETDVLNYRLIVDGVWLYDPQNNNSFLTDGQLKVSSLNIPKNFEEDLITPLINNNGNVQFIYKDQKNKHIYLSGNFNNWDPFMYKMEEDLKDPGTYRILLRMVPGKHFYTFVSDGVTMQDPSNPRRAIDNRGNDVSFIEIN